MRLLIDKSASPIQVHVTRVRNPCQICRSRDAFSCTLCTVKWTVT